MAARLPCRAELSGCLGKIPALPPRQMIGQVQMHGKQPVGVLPTLRLESDGCKTDLHALPRWMRQAQPYLKLLTGRTLSSLDSNRRPRLTGIAQICDIWA